ncbi:MAG: hypothetical protein JSS75_13700 [Bacteroidetes bacterium]|nr:hypothetical protein [Bacteroidota bacterium]
MISSTPLSVSAFHDSIVVQLHRADSNIFLFQLSVNGGKDWRDIVPPSHHKLNPIGAYPLSNTGILLAVGFDDSIQTLVVSTDRGLTWADRARLNDFIPDLPQLVNHTFADRTQPYILTDPHYPYTDWFVKYSMDNDVAGATYSNERIYVTQDGGNSWSRLNIPLPSNYARAADLHYDIFFDYRDSNSWYFRSVGIVKPHFDPPDTTTEYYVSRDHGASFKRVDYVGDMTGVFQKGEQFQWGGFLNSRSIAFNVATEYVTTDTNGNQHTDRLLERIMPGKYPLDTPVTYPNGYVIGAKAEHILPSDPLQCFFTALEVFYDMRNDSIYFDSSSAYYTNDWQHFQLLWQRPARGRIGFTYLDPIMGEVYLVSIDTPVQTLYKNGWERQSLWKRKVFATTPDAQAAGGSVQEHGAKMYFFCSMPPASPDLCVLTEVSGPTSIAVYDMLGRKVRDIYSGFLASGLHKFRIAENASFVTGTYIVRCDNSGSVAFEKCFLVR